MTVTSTPRFGIDRPGAGTDPFARTELLDLIDAVEGNAAMYAKGTLAARPAPGTDGRLYRVSSGASVGTVYWDDGVAWQQVNNLPKTIRVGHTFTISGAVAVASGDTAYIPPFYLSLPTGQTATAVLCRHRINSGTSATVTLQKRNGATVTALSTGIAVSTTETTTDFSDVALADNDRLELVVTATSGAPQNLTITVFVEYTV